MNRFGLNSALACLAWAGFSALVLAGCNMTPAKMHGFKMSGPALPTIRVKAGIDEPLTDSQGVVWAADTGYDEGTEVDRPDLQVRGTQTPEIYRSERYSMNSYSFKVPNGSYLVKLHFSEDYDGIEDVTKRLFTYAVKDGDARNGKTVKEEKDFSPWKASGAQFKAYVDTVPVNVTTGEITITFTPEVENPQINALEIVPKVKLERDGVAELDHVFWMNQALALAQQAAAQGEIPVGAVVVHHPAGQEPRPIGVGFNRREAEDDPTAHAEIVAMRKAGQSLGSWRLLDCTLYVTLEPCPMCAGAMVQGRLERVVYGCADPKAGAVETLYRLGTDGRLNHRMEAVGGVMADEAAAPLREFFGARRGR